MLVIAWFLVIILLITPRTSLVLGGNGILGGRSGGSTVISVGGRPWLQKVAAITVGISLFIATFNTFVVVEDQYEHGPLDSQSLAIQVVGSTELRVIRVISDTFLWLAQVQTLIRLFPRHREKVIIKWAGFALIFLDELFSILNYFVAADPATLRPRKFTEAIPALSYLFDLALSLLYASWVVYYAFEKRRFAFWHAKMHNILIVAALSLLSVSIPIVFFSIDIAKPSFAGWGDYVRWVGAAAASVVVWEWVERIEALEREERKDGILGREIFEDDEMHRMTSGSDIRWPRSRHRRSRDGDGDDDGEKGLSKVSSRSFISRVKGSKKPPLRSDASRTSPSTAEPGSSNSNSTTLNNSSSAPLTTPTVPQPTASPVSRSDTTSAASTVYAVIHHTSINPASHLPPVPSLSRPPPLSSQTEPETQQDNRPRPSVFPNVPNPFKRRRHSPPPEVSSSAVDQKGEPSAARSAKERSARDFFSMGLRRSKNIPVDELPVVVIPAQPRGRVWSPPVNNDSDAVDNSHVVEERQVNEESREQIDASEFPDSRQHFEHSPDPTSVNLRPNVLRASSPSQPRPSAPLASDARSSEPNPFTFEALNRTHSIPGASTSHYRASHSNHYDFASPRAPGEGSEQGRHGSS